MNMGSKGLQCETTPVLVDHGTTNRHGGQAVGHVLSSYRGADGSFKILGRIHDPDVQAQVRSGEMRGLSLRTQALQDANGNVLNRQIEEVSVCEQPRRPGCWIEEIDDKRVAPPPHLASRRTGTGTCPLPLAPCPLPLRRSLPYHLALLRSCALALLRSCSVHTLHTQSISVHRHNHCWHTQSHAIHTWSTRR